MQQGKPLHLSTGQSAGHACHNHAPLPFSDSLPDLWQYTWSFLSLLSISNHTGAKMHIFWAIGFHSCIRFFISSAGHFKNDFSPLTAQIILRLIFLRLHDQLLLIIVQFNCTFSKKTIPSTLSFVLKHGLSIIAPQIYEPFIKYTDDSIGNSLRMAAYSSS